MTGPSFMGSLFQRTLEDLIKGVCLHLVNESTFISTSLDKIRREVINQESNLTKPFLSKIKKKMVVQELLFSHLFVGAKWKKKWWSSVTKQGQNGLLSSHFFVGANGNKNGGQGVTKQGQNGTKIGGRGKMGKKVDGLELLCMHIYIYKIYLQRGREMIVKVCFAFVLGIIRVFCAGICIHLPPVVLNSCLLPFLLAGAIGRGQSMQTRFIY